MGLSLSLVCLFICSMFVCLRMARRGRHCVAAANYRREQQATRLFLLFFFFFFFSVLLRSTGRSFAVLVVSDGGTEKQQ